MEILKRFSQIFVIMGFAILLLDGCAHNTCNNVPQRPQPTAEATAKLERPSAPPQVPLVEGTGTVEKNGNVQIFHRTGEQQCGMEKPKPMEYFEGLLAKKRIKVIEGHIRSDGLMHMQVCGAPTDQIYVFTIPEKFLKQAEKLGFRQWLGGSK